jgi:hypothetical protein
MPYWVQVAVERVSFLVHKGRQVLLLDLTRASVEEIATVISTARPLIHGAAPGSVLTLTDITEVAVRDASTSHLVAFMKENRPYVKAAAATGASDLARAILASVRILTGRQLNLFKTRQDALDWLVSVP